MRNLNFLLNLGGGQSDGQASILLLVDNSPSMKGEPLRLAKLALATLVRSSRVEDRLAVAAFGRDFELQAEFSDCREYTETQIDGIEVAGDATRLFDALKSGAELLAADAGPLRFIVLLSDGEDNSSSIAKSDCLQLLEQGRISVFCVGYSAAGAVQGLPTLEEISKATRARSLSVPTPGELQAAYREVFDAIEETRRSVRGEIIRQLGEAGPGRLLTSRFVSLDATGPSRNDDAFPEADNPFLSLRSVAAGSDRTSWLEGFRRDYLESGALEQRVVGMLTRQAADLATRKVEAGGLTVFIVGDARDSLTLGVSLALAEWLRDFRGRHQGLIGGTLRVVGLFFVNTGVVPSQEWLATLYAWLTEVQSLLGFDAVVVSTSNNRNTAENPGGFLSLAPDQFRALLAETVAAVNTSDAVVARLVSGGGPDQGALPRIATIGTCSFFVSRNAAIGQVGSDYLVGLLESVQQQKVAAHEVDPAVEAFFKGQGLDPAVLNARITTLPEEQKDLLLKLRFELERYWPFTRQMRAIYQNRENYLANLPDLLREYGQYVLDERLGVLRASLETNRLAVEKDLAVALRSYTDRHLFQGGHPRLAQEALVRLRDRVSGTFEEFKKVTNPSVPQQFTQHAPPAGEHSSPDAALQDLVEQVRKMPLPEAIYGRYAFLGLLVALGVDQVARLVPGFLVNLGPFSAPMLLGLPTLLLFVAAGWWKHSLAERQLNHFVKAYAAALEAQAQRMASRVVQGMIVSVYDKLLQAIGAREPYPPESELGKYQALIALFARIVEGERTRAKGLPGEESFFHSALNDLARNDLSRVMKDIDWPAEVRQFSGELLPVWRSVLFLVKERRFDAWLMANGGRVTFLAGVAKRGAKRFRDEVFGLLGISRLLSTLSTEERKARFDQVRRNSFCPVYGEEAIHPERIWAAGAGDLDGLPSVFPHLAPGQDWEALADAIDDSHVRFCTTDRIEPGAVDVVRLARDAYHLLEPAARRLLHTADEAVLADPCDGKPLATAPSAPDADQSVI